MLKIKGVVLLAGNLMRTPDGKIVILDFGAWICVHNHFGGGVCLPGHLCKVVMRCLA